MFAHKLHKNFRGDTIVEVLVAMAVAGSVLAITYSTMNRNLLLTRVAQERSEAAKWAQGQVEALKARSDSNLSIPTTGFCVDSTATSYLTGSAPVANVDNEDYTQYPASCTKGFYHLTIKQDTTAAGGADGRLYKIYVRWDRVDGLGRDQVIMVYRR